MPCYSLYDKMLIIFGGYWLLLFTTINNNYFQYNVALENITIFCVMLNWIALLVFILFYLAHHKNILSIWKTQ